MASRIPRCRVLVVAMVIAVAILLGENQVFAAPVEQGVRLSPDRPVTVVDLRAEDECAGASLPTARCLPASSLFDMAGNPVAFHALRWLMGTIGVTGHETIALYSDDANDALAVAGLLYVAGQARVQILVTAQVTRFPGSPRGLSREVVYTAPLRDHLLRLGKADIPVYEQLAALARHDGETTVTFDFRN